MRFVAQCHVNRELLSFPPMSGYLKPQFIYPFPCYGRSPSFPHYASGLAYICPAGNSFVMQSYEVKENGRHQHTLPFSWQFLRQFLSHSLAHCAPAGLPFSYKTSSLQEREMLSCGKCQSQLLHVEKITLAWLHCRRLSSWHQGLTKLLTK